MLLHDIRLRPRQKLGLGFMLSLSVFLIAVNIIRGASVANGTYLDIIWSTFLMQLLESTAIIMASLVVFPYHFHHQSRDSNGRAAQPPPALDLPFAETEAASATSRRRGWRDDDGDEDGDWVRRKRSASHFWHVD